MSWFVYVVQIKPPADRNDVMRKLAEVGVPSRPYFTPIHLQPFYREQFGYQRGDFPATEYLGDVCLALPFSSVMEEDHVEYVCEQLKEIVAQVPHAEGDGGRVSWPGLAEPATAELPTV
jgi:dTDP-4-amino-4,6-dideoxygalactose transaminase